MRSKKKTSQKLPCGPRQSAVLDSFTAQDLNIWEMRSADLKAYRDRAYFALERQRASHYDKLCAALRDVPAINVPVDSWVRVTDWRWSLTPPSATGSLKGIRGRFNIGGDLDRARGQEFPSGRTPAALPNMHLCPISEAAHAIEGLAKVAKVGEGAGEATAAVTKSGDNIYRYGNDAKSASRLGRKSVQSEAKGFSHGVSGSTKDLGSGACVAKRSDLEANGFQVTQTGKGPNRVKVEMPKPITSEDAKISTRFGRDCGCDF